MGSVEADAAVKSCVSGRSIELSSAADQILIRFPYETKLVTVVRGLSRRRFDQIAKCWCCPVDLIIEVVDALLPHDFAVGASAFDLYVARGGTSPISASADARGMTSPPKCLAPDPPLPPASASDDSPAHA